MNIGKWELTLKILFLSVFLTVNIATGNMSAASLKVEQRKNPFHSLLPENENLFFLSQSHSKSGSKKIKGLPPKKAEEEKRVLSSLRILLPELKTSRRTDIFSRTKQLN